MAHPPTIPTLCPVAVAALRNIQTDAVEKNMLDEYLGQSGDMPVVIANLENLLADNDLMEGGLKPQALFDARSALIALNNLQAIINVEVL